MTENQEAPEKTQTRSNSETVVTSPAINDLDEGRNVHSLPLDDLQSRPRGTTFGTLMFLDLFMPFPSDVTILTPEAEIRRRKVALFLISLSILFQACAFYTITFAFKPVLDAKPYGWSSFEASNILELVSLLQYFSAFVATVLTDTYFERFSTIMAGYATFVVGYLIFVVSQLADHKSCSFASFYKISSVKNGYGPHCEPLIVLALCAVGLGSGIYNGNILIFGADQTTKLSRVPVFFHAYFWCTKMGGLISCYILNYLLIKFDHFTSSLISSAACLMISVVCFWFGKRFYTYRDIQKDLVPTVFKILRNCFSAKNRRNYSLHLGKLNFLRIRTRILNKLW